MIDELNTFGMEHPSHMNYCIRAKKYLADISLPDPIVVIIAKYAASLIMILDNLKLHKGMVRILHEYKLDDIKPPIKFSKEHYDGKYPIDLIVILASIEFTIEYDKKWTDCVEWEFPTPKGSTTTIYYDLLSDSTWRQRISIKHTHDRWIYDYPNYTYIELEYPRDAYFHINKDNIVPERSDFTKLILMHYRQLFKCILTFQKSVF